MENGGDLYLWSRAPRIAALYAGADHPLTGRVGLRLTADHLPMGVCTSSGTLGPSRSFGRADAAMALSPDGALADAVATALGNPGARRGGFGGGGGLGGGPAGMTGALAVCQGRLAARRAAGAGAAGCVRSVAGERLGRPPAFRWGGPRRRFIAQRPAAPGGPRRPAQVTVSFVEAAGRGML